MKFDFQNVLKLVSDLITTFMVRGLPLLTTFSYILTKIFLQIIFKLQETKLYKKNHGEELFFPMN